MASDEPAELNLTPYLDVLMNLIVFVLVSGAGLLSWGMVPARSPAVSDHGREAVVPRLHLKRSGMTLRLAGELPVALTVDELPARLSGVGGRALVLEAESEVTLEEVISAMDAARKARFDEVTLAD